MHHNQHVTMELLLDKYLPKAPAPGTTVYDIGSLDVNGTHKESITSRGYNYLGVDLTSGPNVDRVVFPYSWNGLPTRGCQAIISGSCLEHVPAPWRWAEEARNRLAPGGLIIVILPFTLGEHRFPVDCYRILPDGLRHLFEVHAGIACLETAFTRSGEDTFFVGRG